MEGEYNLCSKARGANDSASLWFGAWFGGSGVQIQTNPNQLSLT